MDMNAPRSNPYVRDILGQPEALSHTAERLPGTREANSIAVRSTGRLILTGMGASFHALIPVYYTLIRRGRQDVHLVETSELVHGLLGLVTSETTVVVTSQSGRSAEIVTLLSTIPSDVTVIGVTNTDDGTLASDADVVILTDAGVEHSVSSKTYTTALLALEWVGRALCGTSPGRLADGYRRLGLLSPPTWNAGIVRSPRWKRCSASRRPSYSLVEGHHSLPSGWAPSSFGRLPMFRRQV